MKKERKYFNSKKFVELEKQLTELLKNYPKSYPLHNLQGAYKKIIGDFDKAEIAFKEAIKINDERYPLSWFEENE